MIADFLTDDEPLAQELNEVVDIIQSNSRKDFVRNYRGHPWGSG